MKTINELQAAREAENKASNFDGIPARRMNDNYIALASMGLDVQEFPISADAELRARSYGATA